jgi:hypothetical protein
MRITDSSKACALILEGSFSNLFLYKRSDCGQKGVVIPVIRKLAHERAIRCIFSVALNATVV